MKTLNAFATRLFAFGAGTSMALVFAIIFVNSLRRYTVGESVSWGEELPIYLTIYGVMFGLALAYLQDRHIRFTILTDFLSETSRNKLFIAVDLVSCITGVVLAFSGHAFAVRRGHIDASGLKSAGNWLVDTTGIEALIWVSKVGTWQYAIAIGGALLAFAAFLKLIDRISAHRAVPA